MSMFAGVGVLVPLIEYFRPSKSPYLITAVSGIAALLIATQLLAGKHIEKGLVLCTPFYLILPVITILACFSKFEYSGNIEGDKKIVEDQLKFSRAISISAAMLCLVLAGTELPFRSRSFYLNYISCMAHIFIFLVYMAFRSTKEEKIIQFNFFQFSFITTCYLVGAAGCFVAAEEKDKVYAITGHFFYFLWAFCEIFWIDKIFNVSQFTKMIRLGKVALPKNVLRVHHAKKIGAGLLFLVLLLYYLNIITEYRVHYYLSRFKGSLFYNMDFTRLDDISNRRQKIFYCVRENPGNENIISVEIANKLSFWPKTVLSAVTENFEVKMGPLESDSDVLCTPDGRYIALIHSGWFVDMYDLKTGEKKPRGFNLNGKFEEQELQALEEYHHAVSEIIKENPLLLYRK